MSDDGSEPNTAAHDGEETCFVPSFVSSDAQTGAVNLAWSAADTTPEVDVPADSHRPLSKTLLAFLAGVGVAAVALGAFVLGEREPEIVNTAPTQQTSAAPSPTSSVAPVPPPAVAPQPTSAASVATPAPTEAPEPLEPAPSASTVTSPPVPQPTSPDDTFIARLQSDGITFDSQDQAFRVAREVCMELGLGNRAADIAAAVKADNPTLSGASAADFVGLSVNAYCPQYKRNCSPRRE
jgi:hypothetical protein